MWVAKKMDQPKEKTPVPYMSPLTQIPCSVLNSFTLWSSCMLQGGFACVHLFVAVVVSCICAVKFSDSNPETPSSA